MLAEKEVCDAAAESLARAVVPTLFVPLLGARDIKTTREVTDPAERVARVWSAGGAVSRAVGDAVDKFGIAPDGASVVAAAVDLLEAVAKLYAAELAINATVLAPRKSIEDLIRGQTETAVLQGWRHELIGQRLQDKAEYIQQH